MEISRTLRPVNTAFDPGCRRRRPRGSFAAASAVAPIARAPASAPTRNITTKKSGAAGDITIVRPALSRVDLLVLDDWGPEPLNAEQRYVVACRLGCK